MIDLALTLTDYLIKLLQKREDNVDEYFERYVLPAYEAAEAVFSDYLVLLTEIKKKIEQVEDTQDLIRFLEEGRVKYLPIRMKLRAEITSRFDPSHAYRFHEINMEKLPKFERGILGILLGGLAPFEDQKANETPYYRSHTLLDLLYYFSSYASLGASRAQYRRIVDWQIEALKQAWEDVVSGYAEYKKTVVPTPSNKTFIKPAPLNSSKIRYKRQDD